MSSTGPVEHRDIRSASVAFKRDRDHNSKWGLGMRPSGGVQQNWISGDLVGGSEDQRMKVRPMKQWTSDHKSHQNKTPKATSVSISYAQAGVAGRLSRKVDAMVDASEHTSSALSKSLLDLLPQHANNKSTSVRTHQGLSEDSTVSGILYSYDTKGPSPTGSRTAVDLGGLVEQAEMKWKSKETEKIVKGEYEVLDNEGETTILSKGKGKNGSPKQKVSAVVANPVDEDDGFELI